MKFSSDELLMQTHPMQTGEKSPGKVTLTKVTGQTNEQRQTKNGEHNLKLPNGKLIITWREAQSLMFSASSCSSPPKVPLSRCAIALRLMSSDRRLLRSFSMWLGTSWWERASG